MTEKWNHNSILGITDSETIKLDFDDMPFRSVKYWAFRTMKWFKLKGFIILKSSKNCYHVVFDRKVSWSENVKVMAWVCLLSGRRNLNKWFLMQGIKQGSTLRVSPKRDKPSPRVVFRYGSQDHQVAEFLAYRKVVKGMVKKMSEKESIQGHGELKMEVCVNG